MLCWVFFSLQNVSPSSTNTRFFCVWVCVCASVCSAFSLSLFFFFPFLLLFSWAVVWVNLAWGSMYIIKTGLGFVGCQSINQSEFNYQACDGKRWQAPGLLDSISYGAAATKNKKLESTCAWVDAGWEEGGEMEGRRGRSGRSGKGGGGKGKVEESCSWNLQLRRGKKNKQMFCVLKTKTMSFCFSTKNKVFNWSIPMFCLKYVNMSWVSPDDCINLCSTKVHPFV